MPVFNLAERSASKVGMGTFLKEYQLYSFLFYPYTPMCVSTVYFPWFSEKISLALYSSGIRTHDLCNSRALSYKHDHRDCPAAIGI